MLLNQLLEFKKDLYFEGAVQADWFYTKDKSKKVAENFVFHGKKYYGIDGILGNKRIDTISFVKTIGEKINDDNNNPLSLAIADYGTGKSHLAVTLAQLLSGPEYMSETFHKIVSNISKIDSREGKEISSLYSGKNLVLVLNGMKDFNLHSELLKSAQKALLLHGISDEKLRKINKSIETAEMFFERNHHLFSDSFEQTALKYNWTEKGSKLFDKLRKNILTDEIAFDIINEVYEQTTGHKIRWDEGLSATNILEELVSEYCGANGEFDSVIILFDEFGRYLEYASGVDSGKSGDSALQQMFECSQNLEGRLHIVNFIQSDIKTYLQRVDNTKNISRYIGRYDVSDKYYISSNLETVFANLIYRKDPDKFDKVVVKQQKMYEENWTQIFNCLNKWCSLNGIWSEYSLFRNVIVEGIYPMHPISTFMLSQLSDYLQNRSSLTLISQYINKYSEENIEDKYFTILPETLMTGDLFTEMLSAEQEGKQSSQHCIRYYNVLRKYEEKLNDKQLKVLRSNLILRILKCRTTSYDEVIFGLTICSGLDIDEVKEALEVLEEGYGILGYDDRACCFDFMEESNGAYDYKIIKKRVLSVAKFDPSLIRGHQEVIDLAGFDSNIETNYGTLKRIFSMEWQYKQQLYVAEDITEKMVDNFIEDWKNSVDPDKPKGQILWLYICKDTSYEVLSRIQQFSNKLKNKPIYMMLLNDIDNRLYNDLIEYSVLDELDEKIKKQYERHYLYDVDQNRERIRNEFNNLKKERVFITPTGVERFKERLPKELSKTFELIYPDVVSFNFDGLITIKKNIAPKSTKNFFTIVQMLLSSDMNENNVHNLLIEVRNRIEALLYYKSNTSWKCLNEQYHIVPPEDSSARKIFDLLDRLLNQNESILIAELYDQLTKPPYGLNTYSFILMVSIFLANLDYCTRVVYEEDIYSTKAWRNIIFKKEGKIEFDVFKKSKIIKVDAGATEEKFIKLFKTIEDNRSVENVEKLDELLGQMLKENVIPERLEDTLKLAQKTINDGRNAKREWKKILNEIKKLNDEMSPNNLYPGFQAIKEIQETDFNQVFNKYKYSFESYHRSELTDIKLDIEEFIDEHFDEYLNHQRCNEVERLIQFKNHGNKNIKLLRELGYNEYANSLQDHIDLEIENVEKIRDKQNLKKDCDEFFRKCRVNKNTTFVQLKEYMVENKRLIELYNEFKNGLGKDAERIKVGLIKSRDSLKAEYEQIFTEISDIFDSMYEISTLHEINVLINRCDAAIKRGLPDKDKNSLEDVQNDLISFSEKVEVLQSFSNDRILFKEKSKDLVNEYQEIESEITEEIVQSVITNLEDQINQKENLWKKRYLEIEIENPKEIYQWKENTKNLPSYLSQETINEYKCCLEKAEMIISKDKINTAIHYYDLLSDEEKIKFSQLIKLL